jgi:uncharacterized RDD family membrane protein YckC
MKQTTYKPPDDTFAKALTGQPLASFIRRAIALVIDFIVAWLIFLLIVVGLGSLLIRTGLIAPESNVSLQFTFFKNWYSIVWLVLYFTLSIYLSNGRTIGKRICSIRVLSVVDHKISLWHSFERALGYGASVLEAGFGFFQYFIRPDRRTVHDRIAETVVVYQPRLHIK